MQFCLGHLICVKMVAFQLGEQRKVTGGQVRQVGYVGDDSHVAFGERLPGEKGSVRRCFVMMQQPVLRHQSSGRSLCTF
jgi:hypothetical protein